MIYKFYSNTCLPCKQLTAFLEHNSVNVVNVNIADEQNAALIEKFGVMSVPVLARESGEKIVGFNATLIPQIKEFLSL